MKVMKFKSKKMHKTMVHTHNGTLLSHNEEWNYGICSKWKERDTIMLSVIGQSQKPKARIFCRNADADSKQAGVREKRSFTRTNAWGQREGVGRQCAPVRMHTRVAPHGHTTRVGSHSPRT